jgi:hypothetical protein
VSGFQIAVWQTIVHTERFGDRLNPISALWDNGSAGDGSWSKFASSDKPFRSEQFNEFVVIHGAPSEPAGLCFS